MRKLTDIHVVSFDIPYPPNYGGVIDVYNKLISLAKENIKIHLHCFQYRDKKESNILNELCASIHYYPRLSYISTFYKNTPYIVSSRASEELLKNLQKNNFPILFEGIHTCAFLHDEKLKNRIKAVRMHNVEWEYYKQLGEQERNFFRKLFFNQESGKLKKYEDNLDHANIIFSISPEDQKYFSAKYSNVAYLPPFHPNFEITSELGKGDYAIYHGNLDVVENHQAALWLVTKVFKDLDYNLIIAGKNPKTALKKLVATQKNCTLEENPSFEKMDDLIQNAHIQILPTFQQTGVKLKLLNAMYQGRFVIANHAMVDGTGLENLCYITDHAPEMQALIHDLSKKEFTTTERTAREKILNEKYSNATSIQILIETIENKMQ